LVASDNAVDVDDIGKAHLCDGLDDARSGNASNAALGGCVGEAGIVGPKLTADDFESAFFGVWVDTNTLNRARRSALTAGNLRPLEGRTRG